MGIEVAAARVAQILAMEQQLAAPLRSSTVAGATAGTTSATPATTTGGTGAPFASVLASAQSAYGASGPPGAAADTSAGAGGQVQAMTNMADSLIGKPYVLGGGHGGWNPSAGYDCSGFVSAVLHAGGYLQQPVDTTALPNQAGMAPGPGQRVTVYDRALPGESGHVIIEIDGQFYESGGFAGPWGGGGGVQRIGRPSDAYLASFPTVLHPSGL